MQVNNACVICMYILHNLASVFISDWFKYSLSANWTFSLWCVALIKSVSLNWPWFTKILGQFVTRMRKNWLILKINCEYHIKHILMSPIIIMMTVFKILTYIITSITAIPIRQCIPNHLVSYNVSLIELPHTVYFQLIGPI